MKQKLIKIMKLAEIKIESLLSKIPVGQYPIYTKGGKWVFGDKWSNGFFCGILWLLYDFTHNEKWKKQAYHFTNQLNKYQHQGNFQDIGYIFFPSYVKGYELTKDTKLANIAITAVDALFQCVQPDGYLSCSWKEKSSKTAGIDSFMNMQLFLWAYTYTNDDKYKIVCENIISSADGTLLNNDGSSNEYVVYGQNGNIEAIDNHNAHNKNSVWARGHSWAINGLIKAMLILKNTYYGELLNSLITFYEKKISNDFVPLWDLCQQGNVYGDLKDSSAGAIIFSGLSTVYFAGKIEQQKKYLLDGLTKYLLSEEYINWDNKEHEGLLLHASTPLKFVNHSNESQIWGDYFLIESIMKWLKEDSLLF